jgi:hypothetical protein
MTFALDLSGGRARSTHARQRSLDVVEIQRAAPRRPFVAHASASASSRNAAISATSPARRGYIAAIQRVSCVRGVERPDTAIALG